MFMCLSRRILRVMVDVAKYQIDSNEIPKQLDFQLYLPLNSIEKFKLKKKKKKRKTEVSKSKLMIHVKYSSQ